MADEDPGSDRKTHMIKVTDPSDPSSGVSIKLVDGIRFLDPKSYGQESQHTLVNTNKNTSRKVHVVNIVGSDGTSKLSVERIDQFSTIDPKSYGQESRPLLTGNAPNSDGPGGLDIPKHYKVHYFQVYDLDANGGDPTLNGSDPTQKTDPTPIPGINPPWIMMQRIDKIDFVDPKSYGQETQFSLVNRDDDMSNPTDLDTDSNGTTINPPWRFDYYQNPVDVKWGIPGACVITSHAGQVFYASDPTNWQEFDLPGWFDAAFDANYGYPLWRWGQGGVTCDLLHKNFWVIAEYIISDDSNDTTVNLYKSPTPKFTGGWQLAENFTVEYSSPGPEYWVNTGFLNAYGGPYGAPVDDGGGPWTIDGGHTWDLTDVPPDALQDGFQFPVFKWNDLYLAVGGGNPFILTDANGNNPVSINLPSGWVVDQGKIAAGNGLIVAVLSDSNSPEWRVGVSQDNETWTMLSTIGDIPSITPNSSTSQPGGGTPSPYFNFNDALLTFVPGFGPSVPGQTGLFVFTACTASAYSFQWWGPAATPGGEPTLESTIVLIADPLQIYTSPDGVNWTKQFQADYTNNSIPPAIISPGAPSYTDFYIVTQDPPTVHIVPWPFAPKPGWPDTDSLGPADGGFIAHDGPPSPGNVAVGVDYEGTGFTDYTLTTTTWGVWEAQANEGAALNGYSVSGSPPGTVTAVFPSPPNYEYTDQFSFPAGFYGDQTFTYSTVYLYTTWGFDPGQNQFGGVNSFTMTPQSIAGSGYTFPILPTP
jgi:hypothetical protein